MIKPTVELLKEAIEDADELIEYVLSSSGDPNLPEWLEDDVEVYYECSCCGIYNFGQSHYCPGCGAKMAVKETLL